MARHVGRPSAPPRAEGPRRGRTIGTALTVAALLALLSLSGDTPGTPRSVGILGNLAAPWVLGGFGVGLVARSPGRGALWGTAALLAAAAGYYAASFARGYASPSLAMVYVAAALVAGPVAGVSGAPVAGTSQWRPLAASTPAAIVIGEVVWVAAERGAWRWDLAAEPHRAADLAVLVVLAALGLAIPAVAVRDRRRRWLLPLTVTLGAAAAALFEVVDRVRVG